MNKLANDEKPLIKNNGKVFISDRYLPPDIAAVLGRQTSRAFLCFFFNDTATTEIYTLSLHDALPISAGHRAPRYITRSRRLRQRRHSGDRKSTRLNSSHPSISYAGFCLKKKHHQ